MIIRDVLSILPADLLSFVAMMLRKVRRNISVLR